MNLFLILALFFQFFLSLFSGFFAIFMFKARHRRLFESYNGQLESHQSFKNNKIKADVSFEVSSEGELEEVLPLIKEFLSQNKKIELIFCSHSLDSKCEKLYEAYPHQIRLFRLPLFHYIPFLRSTSVLSWKTSSLLVLCRYDFFPELLFKTKNEKKVLVWGSLKSFEKKSAAQKFILKKVYKIFDLIICAGEKDLELFSAFISKEKLFVFDFRPVEIFKRLEKKEKKIEEIFRDKKEALAFFSNLEKDRVDVLGNYWPVDASLLSSYSKINGRIVFIVPHLLNQDMLLKLYQSLEEEVCDSHHIFELNQETDFNKLSEFILNSETLFIIVNIKGFLCELYSYASRVYVSGGFGRSVHSILEPAVSQNIITCGPKVFRSTEFDLVQDRFPKSICISSTQDEVISNFSKLTSPTVSELAKWKEEVFFHFDEKVNILNKLMEARDA